MPCRPVTPLNARNVLGEQHVGERIAGDGSGLFTVFFTNGTTAADTLSHCRCATP